jgi:hypothetical protein
MILAAPRPLTTAARLVLGSAPLSGWLVQGEAELDALEHERGAVRFLADTPLWCRDPGLAATARGRNWDEVAVLDGSADLTTLATRKPKERKQ